MNQSKKKILRKMLMISLTIIGVTTVSLFSFSTSNSSSETVKNDSVQVVQASHWRFDDQKGWIYELPEITVTPDESNSTDDSNVGSVEY